MGYKQSSEYKNKKNQKFQKKLATKNLSNASTVTVLGSLLYGAVNVGANVLNGTKAIVSGVATAAMGIAANATSAVGYIPTPPPKPEVCWNQFKNETGPQFCPPDNPTFDAEVVLGVLAAGALCTGGLFYAAKKGFFKCGSQQTAANEATPLVTAAPSYVPMTEVKLQK